MNVNIDLAQSDEIDDIHNLIRETSSWLKAKNIFQWTDFPRYFLEQEFDKDELYVCKADNKLIASFAMSKDGESYWEDRPQNTVYFNRLVIRRDLSGQKLGLHIAQLIEKKLSQENVKIVRLVCDEKNHFLRSYYEDMGFSYKGSMYYEPFNLTFARYQVSI